MKRGQLINSRLAQYHSQFFKVALPKLSPYLDIDLHRICTPRRWSKWFEREFSKNQHRDSIQKLLVNFVFMG